MEYNDFIVVCKDLSKKFTGDGFLDTYHHLKGVACPRLSVRWETGGMTGGSCWMESEDELEPYTTDNPPKNLEILDAILKVVCPAMVPDEYDSLKNELVHEDSYTDDSDYYGNTTDYATKEVDLQKLFDYLREKGFV